jgi:hypothetical protein
MSPYAYCNGNPVNCVDPDGRESLLIIWATSQNGVGHAAFAVENYNNKKPTGTFTVYGLFPKYSYGSEQIKDNKTVQGLFLISNNVTISDIQAGKFNSGENTAPDGILKINSNYSHDKEARATLNKEIRSNKGYNGRSRNCSTFAREGVRAATGNPNIKGTENVGDILIGYDEVVTPNQLYYDTQKSEDPSVVKNAGDKIQYRLNDMIDQAKKQYIKGH